MSEVTLQSKLRPRSWAAYFLLLRPTQWVKNLFCFGGVIFAGKAHNPKALMLAVETVVAFCAVSSAVYVFNDLHDREADARHPKKCRRPIASGQVQPREAALLAVFCMVLAMILAAPLGMNVSSIIAGYLGMHLCYSLGLKRVALLDVSMIAAGFILRIFAGTEAVHVPTSAWILLCTFFLSMFLGFAKRRAELAVSRTPSETRGVLSDYSPELLDRFCVLFAGLAIAAYAVFTTSIPSQRTLIITCPPVVYGILRYLWLSEQHRGHEQIEVLLFRDRSLQMAILLWGVLHVAVLYFGLHLNIQ